MLDASRLRLRFVTDVNIVLVCIDCEHVGLNLAREDLVTHPLSTILAFGEHPCRVVPPPVAAPTPRPDDVMMQAFIDTALMPDPAGVVLLDRLLDDWETRTGRGIDPGYFARRLRAVLPAGSEIRREMIGGVRARRLVGMRLR
jgi:hypothetical protein